MGFREWGRCVWWRSARVLSADGGLSGRGVSGGFDGTGWSSNDQDSQWKLRVGICAKRVIVDDRLLRQGQDKTRRMVRLCAQWWLKLRVASKQDSDRLSRFWSHADL